MEQRRKRLWAGMVCLLMVFASSCQRDGVCDTPIGEGGVIDLYTADYNILNNIGGTASVNRGHRGIMVRCEAFGSYVAFEMTCPQDHDVRLEPDDRDYALLLSCPRCGSRFDLINGNPCTGAATGCPLYRYEAMLVDGHYVNIF